MSGIWLLPSGTALAEDRDAAGLRVVVTTIGDDGISRFGSDGEPGFFVRSGEDSFMGDIWNIAGTPSTNQDGAPPTAYQLEPEGTGGVKFRVAQIPPRTSAEVEGPSNHEGSEHGMHQTNTIDFITIVSGEIWLRLDDGVEKRLRAGDTLVQRGTRHAWINRSDRPCVFSAVMVKAGE
ncbi:MAG: cupin domain-containing protein [bacterium]|nr:cupin [Deltaproteobacteria bacterium]MCP4904706.1 cupin domain-containing protein [bacterium]